MMPAFVAISISPTQKDNHPAATHITTNIIANILGLGWAATPAGLNAMIFVVMWVAAG